MPHPTETPIGLKVVVKSVTNLIEHTEYTLIFEWNVHMVITNL